MNVQELVCIESPTFYFVFDFRILEHKTKARVLGTALPVDLDWQWYAVIIETLWDTLCADDEIASNNL